MGGRRSLAAAGRSLVAHGRSTAQGGFAERVAWVGSFASDDLTGAATQCRPAWWLPGHDGARAGLRAGGASQAGQAGDQPEAACQGAGVSAAALLARADLWSAPGRVPRRPTDARVGRDDLSSPLCA